MDKMDSDKTVVKFVDNNSVRWEEGDGGSRGNGGSDGKKGARWSGAGRGALAREG